MTEPTAACHHPVAHSRRRVRDVHVAVTRRHDSHRYNQRRAVSAFDLVAACRHSPTHSRSSPLPMLNRLAVLCGVFVIRRLCPGNLPQCVLSCQHPRHLVEGGFRAALLIIPGYRQHITPFADFRHVVGDAPHGSVPFATFAHATPSCA